MRVLISDYKDQMESDYSLTIKAVKEVLPEAEIVIESFGTNEFYKEIKKADGWITAFVTVDQTLLEKAGNLKCISQNAVGYSNVCVQDLKDQGIGLCHIEEYCTREVAEHAISLMMALNRNLKRYTYSIENKKEWIYQTAPALKTLDHKCLTIFGLGRIGKQTAKLAMGLGMEVIAVDPFVTEEAMLLLGIKKVEKEEALKKADVIINHMVLTSENYHYFNEQAFAQMQKQPIFINVGRGGSVDETALLKALNEEKIYGAGLDVLTDEKPDLSVNAFTGREDVILTPHSAFYSQNSIEKLHVISGHNLAWCLAGAYDKVEGLVVEPTEYWLSGLKR